MTLGDIDGCLVFGAGGHGKVVIEALQVSGITSSIAVLDADPTLTGQEVMGVRILGGDGYLPMARNAGFSHFVVGFAGTNDGERRGDAFGRGQAAGLVPLTIIHPGSVISSHAKVGGGTVIFAGAVINPEAAIGENVIINTSAVVEHNCRIGNHVHIAPRACLLGNVTVGDMAFVGGGAVINPGVNVGAGAIVGAGAVVTRDVAPGVKVAGVPAAELK